MWRWIGTEVERVGLERLGTNDGDDNDNCNADILYFPMRHILTSEDVAQVRVKKNE